MKPISLLPLLLLPACASMTSGRSQSVLVETTPPAAACELSNEKGRWAVPVTPASATVARANGPLALACEKGKLSGSTSVESATEGAAFGNILAGGIIGAAVDMSSGAAYAYPAAVRVPLAEE